MKDDLHTIISKLVDEVQQQRQVIASMESAQKPLLSTEDLAKRWNKSTRTIQNMKPSLPAPVQFTYKSGKKHVTAAPLWRLRDIERFEERNLTAA